MPTILLLAASCLLLWAGTEAMVRGGVAAARRFALNPVLVGVVLIGYGTSLAELMTGLFAMRFGAPDLTVGLVIGSNIFNALAVVGLCALVAPLAVDLDRLRRDAWFAALATVLGAIILLWGPVDVMDGALLVLVLAVYTLVALLTDPPAPAEAPEALWQGLPLALGGMASLAAGAWLFTGAALDLARETGMSQAVTGAGIVAVGTSLPELSSALVAARRGHADLALGNILGSDMFNVMAVIGVSATLAPIEPAPEALARDLPAMLIATAVLLALIFGARRIGRLAALAMLALYAGYLGALT